MGNNISHLIIGDNQDENSTIKNTLDALGNLEHFSEKEKERGIVIVFGGHIDRGMHTARLLATTLTDKNIVVVNANDLRDNYLPSDTVKSKPTPSMENLITQIAEDLQKRIVVVKDDISSYKILQQADVLHKKEQEKRRRRHLNKKKISTRKKG